MTQHDTNFDHILRSNLERVFNERDDDKRQIAIAELYVDEPVMYEPENIVKGRLGISRVAGELLERFGPVFRFVPEGVTVGHHGLAYLPWNAGPEGGPTAVTGADVARIENDKIAVLWVLLNKP